MAKEWVKSKSNQDRAKAQSRSEVEKALGALKDEHAELTNRLTVAERERNSALSSLKNAETQTDDQRKMLYTMEIELATEKQQVVDLKAELNKAKEAAQLAKEALEAEKNASYLLGVEETQVRLAEELSKVCKEYCDV